MKKEIRIMDEAIAIDEMLTKMGYNTEQMTVDEMLDIRKAIKAAVVKTRWVVEMED